MKFTIHQKRLTYLNVQRNFLVALSAILLTIVVLQTLLLFFKKERTIISPPELKQSYWVEGERFSNSYLEEMALFFTHLLLDVTEANVLPQGEILLRYVTPEAYGDFKSKLLNDEKRLKKQQLSLQFTPQSIEFVNSLIIDVNGFLANYIGAKKVSQVPETYRVGFFQKKGRLFLESFQVIKSDQRSYDELSS